MNNHFVCTYSLLIVLNQQAILYHITQGAIKSVFGDATLYFAVIIEMKMRSGVIKIYHSTKDEHINIAERVFSMGN